MTILPYGRVPPFGYLWINARFQLPKAFRRIPRPSSPLTAKASTVCASLLDHITSAYSRSYYEPIAFLNRSANISLRFCYLNLYLIFNEPLDNPDEITLYQIISSALSLRKTPFIMMSWWVWVDSNHRPHPYQGCALTS